MVDQFTKWVELAAMHAQNAQNADLTPDAFLKYFVITFSCPLEIPTDQDRNFESDLFQFFCSVKLLEITKPGQRHTSVR